MVAIPNPSANTLFDDAKFDDFSYGFDVDVNTYLNLSLIKRFEQTTAGGFRRAAEGRFEQVTPGVFRRVDQ